MGDLDGPDRCRMRSEIFSIDIGWASDFGERIDRSRMVSYIADASTEREIGARKPAEAQDASGLGGSKNEGVVDTIMVRY